ncbi:hypothetical protein [uncultured Sphingomonas sp.]|uniref:hypothetical protein n=1 Tax=uncultured Sphingomonas sp. TaxID=158754 RepID=UPI0035CAC988
MPQFATLVLTRVIRPGRLDRFRGWATDLDRAAAGAPGHDGSVRLEQAGGFHHLLHRFVGADDLARWQASPAYAALMRAGESHSVGRAQAETGDRVSFALPSEATAHKWKTWLVTLVAVLPVLLVISTAVRALLTGWPPIAQTALSSPILTAVLTGLILPRVNRWSRFWQVQDSDGRVGKSRDRG